MYDAFLGSMLGASMRSSGDSRYCRGSALTDKRICLLVQPTHFNARPSVRGPYASASRLTLLLSGGTGILTRFPSPTPFGLGLGPD